MNFHEQPITVHHLAPGSPEWHAHRAKLWNASDAPAMLGVSPYRKRSELIRQMATGVIVEPTTFEEGLHESGHRFEELARPVAEALLGEDLYQTVLSRGRLGCSLDGQNFMGTILWEHKRLNNEIRAAIPEGEGIATGVDFPPLYAIQMEQQCMISGAKRVLFSATLWQGERLVEQRHAWYDSNPDLARRILAGWAQAYQDALAYTPETKADPVKKAAAVRVNLPALVVRCKGEVTESNLPEYRAAVLEYVAGINEDLQTDEDFGAAEEDAKFCETTEEKVKLLIEQVMEQAADVNAVVTTLTDIRVSLGRKRLDLRKKATDRKAEKREEVATAAQKKLDEHIDALNRGLKEPWIEKRRGSWGEAMKRKQSIAACQEAVDVMLADLKVQTSEEAARLGENAKVVEEMTAGTWLLFVDFARHGLKPAEDFRALAKLRWDQHQENERKRLAVAPPPAPAPPPAEPPAAAPAQPIMAGGGGRASRKTLPPLSTKEVCELLGFDVTVAFLVSLGFEEAPRPAGKKSGSYWPAEKFVGICNAIQHHVQKVGSSYLTANPS